MCAGFFGARTRFQESGKIGEPLAPSLGRTPVNREGSQNFIKLGKHFLSTLREANAADARKEVA
jgi:hypothetical protein